MPDLIESTEPAASAPGVTAPATVDPGVAPAAASPAAPRYAVFGQKGRKAPADERIFGRRFLRDLGRGIFVVLLLHIFVVQISVVRGLSMEPSLRDGDRLIVDRVTYAMADVDRFDVVVLRNPRNHDVDYVKRVIGLPGERVAIHAGVVEIDGAPIMVLHDVISDESEMPETIVPEGQYFVLGDNRPVSCDSREFGLVQSELLKGKVRLRFWPPSRLDVF